MYADVSYPLVTDDISNGQLKIGNISSKINDTFLGIFTQKKVHHQCTGIIFSFKHSLSLICCKRMEA